MFFLQKEFNEIFETKWGEVGDESKKAEFGDWEKETMDTMLFFKSYPVWFFKSYFVKCSSSLNSWNLFCKVFVEFGCRRAGKLMFCGCSANLVPGSETLAVRSLIITTKLNQKFSGFHRIDPRELRWSKLRWQLSWILWICYYRIDARIFTKS